MTWIDWDKENQLVDDVQIGIEAALDEVDRNLDTTQFTGISGFNGANIKANKFAYMVIEHFNLPILRTWFRYGQYEPHDAFSPQNIHPQPLTKNTKTPLEPSIPNRGYPSPDEIKGYLVSEGILDMVDQDMWKFMRVNYQRYAPDDLRDLYLANLGVLESIENIFNEPMARNVEREYNNIKIHSVRVKQEILANSLFSEKVENHLIHGLHTIRQAIKGIYSFDGFRDREHRKKIFALRWTYHERVWRWIALHISKREAKGGTVDIFMEGWDDEINEANLLYGRHLNQQRKEFIKCNYFPKADEVSQLDNDVDSSLNRLQEALLY